MNNTFTIRALSLCLAAALAYGLAGCATNGDAKNQTEGSGSVTLSQIEAAVKACHEHHLRLIYTGEDLQYHHELKDSLSDIFVARLGTAGQEKMLKDPQGIARYNQLEDQYAAVEGLFAEAIKEHGFACGVADSFYDRANGQGLAGEELAKGWADYAPGIQNAQNTYNKAFQALEQWKADYLKMTTEAVQRYGGVVQ